MSTAEKHGYCHTLKQIIQSICKQSEKYDTKGESVLSDCSHLWGEK